MSQPIRVLQVIGIMNRGGAEAMIMNLYRKIDRSKIQFDFVEHGTDSAVFDDEIRQMGGKIYHCPGSSLKNLFSYIKWWNVFFKGEGSQYQIVHGHIGSTATIYLGIAKKYGKYTIAHSHNTGNGFGFNAVLYKTATYGTRYIADYFFACSKAAGISRYGKKFSADAENCTVLPNAVDTALFRRDTVVRAQLRRELNIPENALAIGHVGRFVKEKNHEFILNVFSELLKVQSEAILLLAGTGPLKEEIEAKACQLGINKSVRFLGVRSDINKLMQAMDIFLFPSIFEGLPVTLVEAQASGLPCVISDIIPKDSILIPQMVTVKSLDENSARWADTLNCIDISNRQDHTEDIIKCGFDVTNTAAWLGDFYCAKSKQ